MNTPAGRIRILVLAFDGVNLLDIGGPLEAFESSKPDRDAPAFYETTVASPHGGTVQTSSRLPIVTVKLADVANIPFDTVMIGGGSRNGRPIVAPELVDWIARAAPRTRRICSICSGAFVLAAAGLLEGRRATTHWHWSKLLQDENPAIAVEADSIFVNDGKVWTSAGVTAGIDLTLALIEQDFGHRVAVEAARRLVVFMKRPGGQAQFSVPLTFQSQKHDGFAELHAWVRQNLAADLTVKLLADHAGMSERAFSRAYTTRVGQTPAKAIEAMRVEAACGLLDTTRMPLKQVAAVAGFGSEQNLRRVFVRRFGLNPLDYRQRFSSVSRTVDSA